MLIGSQDTEQEQEQATFSGSSRDMSTKANVKGRQVSSVQ